MTKHPTHLKRFRHRGSAAAEAAVVLPLLLLLGVGATDLASVSYAGIHVASAAANGAQYGSTSLAAAKDAAGINQAAHLDQLDMSSSMIGKIASAYNYTDTNPTVKSEVIDEGEGNTAVKVTVTYVFSTLARYPGIPKNVTVIQSVRMRVLP